MVVLNDLSQIVRMNHHRLTVTALITNDITLVLSFDATYSAFTLQPSQMPFTLQVPHDQLSYKEFLTHMLNAF